MKNNRLKNIFLVLIMVLYGGLLPQIVFAKDEISLSVTPPLFQVTIGPGEVWKSNLKIINVNSFGMTFYAAPVNFQAEGEEGWGNFIPLPADKQQFDGGKLASWIEVDQEPIFVPAEKSAEVPFKIQIPYDAPPGGHYAAILVSNRPQNTNIKGTSLKVFSAISSLFFLRIKGEVDESGNIREFSVKSRYVQQLAAEFKLRFENSGNVHLRPQGEIIIYDMWGKENGRIPVNRDAMFGNVLPHSIRKFSFTWQQDGSDWSFGRYRAIITLNFGQDIPQTITAVAYFWVLPVKATLKVFGIMLLLSFILAIILRRYIHRIISKYHLNSK